jgi:hypothetical protein
METILLLLLVLLFAVPLFIFASPLVLYVAPLVLVGLAVSYWASRRADR